VGGGRPGGILLSRLGGLPQIRVADEIAGGKLYLRRLELIDLGERLLILADAPTDAQAGDIPPSDPFATLAELKDGRVIRSQEYFDHAEALEAAGLGE